MSRSLIPIESIVILHNNLKELSARDPERQRLQEEASKSFGVSLSTVRRALKIYQKPRSEKRADL